MGNYGASQLIIWLKLTPNKNPVIMLRGRKKTSALIGWAGAENLSKVQIVALRLPKT